MLCNKRISLYCYDINTGMYSNYHTGDTYYEGYVPADWGTQALAVWFHNEMFAYSAWGVEGWD